MAASEKTEEKQKKRKMNPNSLANLRPRNGKNGRKKMPKEFRELVREHSVDALLTIIEIANNPKAKHADRIKAAEIILDRAYGKPTQPIAGEDGGPIMLVVDM